MNYNDDVEAIGNTAVYIGVGWTYAVVMYYSWKLGTLLSTFLFVTIF
jgi:hypothetical protein